MTNRRKISAIAVALAIAIGIGSAVYADEGQHSDMMMGAPSQGGMAGSGTMQGGDMMNMMMQMSQMMETCNKMMQSAMQSPHQPQQTPGKAAPRNQGG